MQKEAHMDAAEFWQAVVRQDTRQLEEYFAPDAQVRWHNTNECFTADEFVRANCAYPNQWGGEVERMETYGDLIITVTRVYAQDGSGSFHAVSFIRLRDDRICSIDEYWGEDGPAPGWRAAMQLGCPIHKVF